MKPRRKRLGPVPIRLRVVGLRTELAPLRLRTSSNRIALRSQTESTTSKAWTSESQNVPKQLAVRKQLGYQIPQYVLKQSAVRESSKLLGFNKQF